MTIGRLREEIESIRSILVAHHSDCRIGIGDGREMNVGELVRSGVGGVLAAPHHYSNSQTNGYGY